MQIPKNIYSGLWQAGHVQGIAIDKKREYMYFSFTNILVKTTINGDIVGSVTGLYGHLGCLTYNEDDNRVYASLEYKNDKIGADIKKRLGVQMAFEDGFYIAIFDGEKIDRLNMNAEQDQIVTCVYLKTVTDDYFAVVEGKNGLLKHKYACSGIDGLSFGPDFGESGDKKFLCVAYGIYGDNSRDDNDYQVILQYDIKDWKHFESTLNQGNIGKKGPENPVNKYFLFTGNTTYGIQNLEYDAYTKNWLIAVYRGEKEKYPNWSMYIIDGSVKPKSEKLVGCYGETGLVLTLLQKGLYDEASGIYGWECEYGTTGIASLGNGTFYISHEGNEKYKYYSNVYLYRWTGNVPCPLERIR